MLWGASYCLEASHCRELLIVRRLLRLRIHCRELLIVRRLLRLRIHCRELLIVVSFVLSGASHCCDLLSLRDLVSHCRELLIVWEASELFLGAAVKRCCQEVIL